MKLPFHASHRMFLLVSSLTLSLAGCLTAQNPATSPTTAPVASPVPTTAEPAISYSAVHVDAPYIALTFDDGPSEKLTPELLDLLAKHHMRATFFVVGKNVVEHPEILQRAAREGHEIANHSWSHPAFGKMGDERVRAELQKTDDAIRAAIGKRPTLMRPPYGSITARQKKWIHSEFGYRTILWDVDPLDWKRPGSSVVTSRILKETRSGSIVLAHDIHPGTIKAMPDTFDQLEAKGFKFVTVSELIAMGKPRPAAEVSSEGPTPLSSPGASPVVMPSVTPTPTPTPSRANP
ncbi:MAG: polysaccharide deacetylase family protein [Chthoniobacterales bacterium]